MWRRFHVVYLWPGQPIDYIRMVLHPSGYDKRIWDEIIHKLIGHSVYAKCIMDFKRKASCVRGDVLRFIRAYSPETPTGLEFFGDEVDRIAEIRYADLGGRNPSWLEHKRFFLLPLCCPEEKMGAGGCRISS